MMATNEIRRFIEDTDLYDNVEADRFEDWDEPAPKSTSLTFWPKPAAPELVFADCIRRHHAQNSEMFDFMDLFDEVEADTFPDWELEDSLSHSEQIWGDDDWTDDEMNVFDDDYLSHYN